MPPTVCAPCSGYARRISGSGRGSADVPDVAALVASLIGVRRALPMRKVRHQRSGWTGTSLSRAVQSPAAIVAIALAAPLVACSSSSSTTGRLTPQGGEVKAGVVRVSVPAGAASESFELSISDTTAPEVASPHMRLLTDPVEIAGSISEFESPVTISFEVEVADLDDGVNPDHLLVTFFDEGRGNWSSVPTTYDAETGVLSGQVDHLTPFAYGVAIPWDQWVDPIGSFLEDLLRRTPGDATLEEEIELARRDWIDLQARRAAAAQRVDEKYAEFEAVAVRNALDAVEEYALAQTASAGLSIAALLGVSPGELAVLGTALAGAKVAGAAVGSVYVGWELYLLSDYGASILDYLSLKRLEELAYLRLQDLERQGAVDPHLADYIASTDEAIRALTAWEAAALDAGLTYVEVRESLFSTRPAPAAIEALVPVTEPLPHATVTPRARDADIRYPTIHSLGCPRAVLVGQQFDCSPAIRDEYVRQYDWSVSGSGSPDLPAQEFVSSRLRIQFAAEGQKRVTLSVCHERCDSGAAWVTAYQTVEVGRPPDARISANTIDGYSPVSFLLRDASAGVVTSREWKRGTITYSEEEVYELTLDAPTSSEIRLVVCNDFGCDEDTVVVTALKPPPFCSVTTLRTLSADPPVGAPSDGNPGDLLAYFTLLTDPAYANREWIVKVSWQIGKKASETEVPFVAWEFTSERMRLDDPRLTGASPLVGPGAVSASPGRAVQFVSVSVALADSPLTHISNSLGSGSTFCFEDGRRVERAAAPTFTIDVASGVSPGDAEAIRGAVRLALAFLSDELGFELQQDFTVSVEVSGQDPSCCVTHDANYVLIDTAHPVWRAAADGEYGGEDTRAKIVAHEVVHVYQHQRGCVGAPRWYLEGVAEWLGYRIMIEAGQLSSQASRDYHLGGLQFGVDPGPLSQNEAQANGSAYSTYYVAVDRLLEQREVDAIRLHCDDVARGVGKDGAFSSAFGIELSEYYESFERYRDGVR